MNDIVIIFSAFSFVCRAQLWANILSVLYSAWTIKVLSWKAVCSQNFPKADLYLLNVYAQTEWQLLLSVQHPHTHIQHQNLQNSLFLSLLWVPRHNSLPVQITFLSRNQLKPIPRCPQWHLKYFQVQSPPVPLAVLTEMLVTENLVVSATKVLPQSAKQGFLY
jgi:hypothetical protein